MKNKKRILLLIIILFGVLTIVLNISVSQKSFDRKISFSNLFQSLGNITSSIDRGVGQSLPIDSLDEKKLGDEIKVQYANRSRTDDKDEIYLKSLLRSLKWSKQKDFEYDIFLSAFGSPNAYAMPGGVIVVTRSLLDVVKSESELVAIIAHEIGHIENSHCFNTVKYEILSKKLKLGDLGKIADFSANVLFRHSYSKTQEAEADDYAFEFLKNSQYDVMGVSNSFKSLMDERPRYEGKNSILGEYFQSHPHIEDRVDKFASKAKVWQKKHPNELRYIGKENLQDRVCLSEKVFSE